MSRKWFVMTIGIFILASALPALAQESTVRGAIQGTVMDTSGAVVPGATVTVVGALGSVVRQSNASGDFVFPGLIPGTYKVKGEMKGFKLTTLEDIVVLTSQTTTVRVTLEPGVVTQEVTVTAGAVQVDTTSTAVDTNLNDTFYEKTPQSRNVTGLFYVAPGVADSGRAGRANPSISGGSGLENMYVADGVNITDGAFGGIGTFSRIYGSVGTGIDLTFVKEVEVKTAGFAPQYGKATGGVIQIVTKSGGNDYHGAISAYLAPQGLENDRRQPDDFRFNKTGKTFSQTDADVSGELGGYVPHLKDRLFFFGSYNPTWNRSFRLAPPKAGLFSHGEFNLRTNVQNWAGKLTYKINENNQWEASGFGDPSHTSTGPFRTLNIDNNTANSRLDFGNTNVVSRYTGTLSPTWTLNGSFTYGHNHFTESGFQDIYQITDLTQTSGLPGQRGRFTPQGLGFVENTKTNTYGANVATTKQFNFAGSHTFTVGYQYESPHFDGRRQRSGPDFLIPATNATGVPGEDIGIPTDVIGQPADATFNLRRAGRSCTLCPLFFVPGRGMVPVFLQQNRGEFGSRQFQTRAIYNVAYIEDVYQPSRYFTLDLGLRYEQQRLEGEQIQYSFTDNWLPRVGISVDPRGNRKSKIYGSFARYDYVLPLDVAERSLTNEQDFFGGRFAPEFTVDPATGKRIAVVNANGTVNPVLDAAHFLTGAAGGTGAAVVTSSQSTEGFAPGTRMEYQDEFVAGYEQQLPGGVVFKVRYVDRRLKRIIEDTGGISPEATNAGVPQTFVIANVAKGIDIFTNPIQHQFAPGTSPVLLDANGNPIIGTNGLFERNPAFPAGCSVQLDPTKQGAGLATFSLDPVEDTFGNSLGAVCIEDNGVNGQPAGAPIPDGVPDGFPNASRIYQAVEIEFNKQFSNNWLLRANWRIANLKGNFEGAFRNDNGQTDPGISSLFDFTEGEFNLLGDQFKPGELNTDRRHIINGFVTYVVPRGRARGLTLGSGVTIQSGIPFNDLKAHPVYLNAGEVPVGGRGALGRELVQGTVDVHVDYPWHWKLGEHRTLRTGVDIFNLANNRRLTFIDQNEDLTFGVANKDFQTPATFNRPVFARFFVRFEF